MTAKDMRHFYSTERLIRTEISTLIGLLIKQPINLALPTSAVTERSVVPAQELLVELHRAIGGGGAGPSTQSSLSQAAQTRLIAARVTREPIFYSGETAYDSQYRDLSTRRYAADNQWLKSNRGFSIEDARNVIDALGRLEPKKSATSCTPSAIPVPTTGRFFLAFRSPLRSSRKWPGLRSRSLKKL